MISLHLASRGKHPSAVTHPLRSTALSVVSRLNSSRNVRLRSFILELKYEPLSGSQIPCARKNIVVRLSNHNDIILLCVFEMLDWLLRY